METHEYANIFPLLDGAQYNELVADIRDNGLREAIVLHDGKILDGRNRHRACLDARVSPHFTDYTGEDPLGYVVSLNLHRRHLDVSQMSMVRARIEGHRPRGGDRRSAEFQAANLRFETTREQIPVSARSVESARTVLQHGIPELGAKVDAGEVAVSTAAEVARLPEEKQAEIVARGEDEIMAAAKEIRRQKAEAKRSARIVRIESIAANEPPPLQSLDRRYPVVYADPPWRYDFAETESRAIENQYPTMELEDICSLPVSAIAADDSVLFLWATSPKLTEALEVMARWGFAYVTNMVWHKPQIGMGYYARQQHELLLIGKRGALPVPDPGTRPGSVVTADREQHSRKPEVFRETIAAMYPTLGKIELFSRSPAEGWDAWGNQAEAA